LWITWSHSLGVNPTGTSPAYKYAIIGKSRWMSRALLFSGSSSSLWEFPPLVLPWGTSLEHSNKVHRYVKACHLDTTSKFTFPCHSATMVSFSLKLGFWFNPSTSQLSLPTLWIISKSYFCRISAHLANLPMSWFDSIKNFRGWWVVTKVNGLPYR
jgi:hypothetical protein